MRILLLAPHFHPYQNPRAHRWSAIARAWAAHGWEVHVVCSRQPGRPREETWQGVHLYRAGFNSVKELAYALFPSMPQRGQPAQNRVTPLLAKLNNALFKPFYWPDEAWLWIAPAAKKASMLLASGQWDAIVSVSLPFSAHWAALQLKSRYPSLCWLADVGDPFSFQPDHPINNEYFYRKKNRTAELQTLQSADRIVVTNENMRKIFPRNNIYVIPPIASFSPDPIPKEPLSPGLHLGYFGAFFRNIREPTPLLRFFQNLRQADSRWTLHLYGEIFENFWPLFERFPELKSYMVFHGAIGREAVVAAMQQMDALVLLGNTTSFQLPSKWADYLLSGKPILHLMQNPDDAALGFLDNTPQVRSIFLDGENIVEEAQAFLSLPPAIAAPAIWRQRFSAEVVAEEYGRLLSNLVKVLSNLVKG